MEQKRIAYLDVARGLAMFGVIYGHVLSRNTGLGKWIYSWHMPIFFLITAILLSRKTEWKQMTYRDLFVKDMKSIMYPYLVFNFIEVITMCFASSVREALKGLFHFCVFDGLQALWFLSALFIARQMFFQLMKRTEKKEVITACVVIVILVTSLFSAARGWVDSQNKPVYTLLYNFANIGNRTLIGFVFLVLGFVSANHLHSIRLRPFVKVVVLLCTLLFSISLFDYNSVDLRFSKIGNPLLFYSLAIAGSVSVFILSDYISHFRSSKVILFMGTNSIVFLATHIPIRDLLAFFFPSIDMEYKELFFLMLIAVEYGVVWLVIRYLPYLYKFPRSQDNRKKAQHDKV